MSSLKSLYHYVYAALVAFYQKPTFKTIWYSLRYAHLALKYSKNHKHSSILDAQPWMPFPAIDALDKFLTKDCKVFEYGSGGSTLFFANKVKEVVSVEHNPEWYNYMREEIAKREHQNVEYKLVMPTISNHYNPKLIAEPNAYISSDDDSVGMSYEDYAKSIELYPDNYFDLVVVDGRARPSCMFHALTKIKKGGVLLLDQSERNYYLEKMQKFLPLNEWSKHSYMAPLPYNLHFTETTFYIKKY